LGTTYVAKRLPLAAEKRATQREKRALATVNTDLALKLLLASIELEKSI